VPKTLGAKEWVRELCRHYATGLRLVSHSSLFRPSGALGLNGLMRNRTHTEPEALCLDMSALRVCDAGARASPVLPYPCLARLGLTPSRKSWRRLETDSGFLKLNAANPGFRVPIRPTKGANWDCSTRGYDYSAYGLAPSRGWTSGPLQPVFAGWTQQHRNCSKARVVGHRYFARLKPGAST
jgi:hypothetical protein